MATCTLNCNNADRADSDYENTCRVKYCVRTVRYLSYISSEKQVYISSNTLAIVDIRERDVLARFRNPTKRLLELNTSTA